MSKIEVDAIDKQSGSTLTLGGSGTAVTLACGATQTGFGRTGTVDWQTGSIKTTTFTAVDGQGFFVDTSSGAVTANLPSGSAGAIVAFADYTNTFQNNNLTISPNGSQKIGGVNANVGLSTEGQSVTLVYVDDTEGWKNVQDSTSNVVGNPFIIATGGTETTSGDDKIHTFTGPGTFTVNAIGSTTPVNKFSHMVIAGGGGAGTMGGGGAGGYREVKNPETPYTASPLDGFPSAPNIVTASVGSFPIAVGGGGAGNGGTCGQGVNGSNSTFSTVTSNGGGGGSASNQAGSDGGSGGGAGYGAPQPGGSGNTPPVSPPQGQNGGQGNSAGAGDARGGGGGGAGAVGANTPGTTGGAGGAGVTSSINGTPTQRAGGGGAGGDSRPPGGATGGAGGAGGGGAGSNAGNNPGGTAGTANTGGGGGAAGYGPGTFNTGAAGGSGIVIIRYKFQ